MTYKMIDDRNSGGCYGEEEQPNGYSIESSEEEGLRNGTRRPVGSRYGRPGASRLRAESEELEELCW